MRALVLYACFEPFSAESIAFPNKKVARRSAAIEAIQFLIEQDLVDLESQNIRIAEKSKTKLEAISNRPFCTQKVNDLSALLGL